MQCNTDRNLYGPTLNNSRATKILCAFFLLSGCILAGSWPTYGQTAATGKANRDRLHGGIFIGLEGIKAALIRVAEGEQGAGAEVIYTREINAGLVRAQNNRFTPETIKAAGQSVLKLYTQMQQEHQVLPQQVYIAGSSDLDAEALESLANEIRNNTGKALAQLSLESEVQLGIIGTIPRRYQEGTIWFDNRSQAVLIDIGSHKIKGGYQQIRQPLASDPYYDFVAFGIPVGTSNFAGEGAVNAALRAQTERKPGLVYRKKIYLKGAIVWAMVTLLRPEDRQPFVTITADDINTFYQRAVNNSQALLNPDLAQLRNEQVRTEIEKDLAAVRSVFTAKRLSAGAEILKAIASAYDFQGEGKKILFARFSNFSSILSYVLLQAENGPQP